jgi:hypothetical protein
MTPAEVASAWQTAVNARDQAALLALTDPEIEIVGPRGVAHGHEILLAWLDRAQLELTTRRSFARGDAVVLAQHGVWAGQSEADVATSFVIRDGKVVRLARYDTIAEALADAGLTVDDELSRT